jgi:phosphate starvation-inducible protein PhoH
MVLGRLGKNSKMILCGDPQQIDLKSANDSAIHEVAKLKPSGFVYTVTLKDNHRHPALDEIFKLLYEY